MSDKNSTNKNPGDSVAASGGEGNRQADRNYRKDVRETVEKTSSEERSAKARNISDKELQEAREAEKKGKSHAKR